MTDTSGVVPKDAGRDVRAEVAELYDQHFDAVWSWLERMGVREADLDDAVHEVFLVVYRKYHEFEGRSRLTTWLFGIATRVAAGTFRRAHVRREQLGEPSEVHADAGPQPDDVLAAREAEALLDRALEGLDEVKRAVFVMYEIDGMTAAAIAELMGCPLQTVYSRLYAARRHFSEAVARLAGRDKEQDR